LLLCRRRNWTGFGHDNSSKRGALRARDDGEGQQTAGYDPFAKPSPDDRKLRIPAVQTLVFERLKST